MNETIAPVVPPLALVLGYSGLALWLVLLAVAIAILIRSDGLTNRSRVVWAITLIILPFVGCVTWLVYYGMHRTGLRPAR